MKRDVIHGPTKYGGNARIHFYAEQGIHYLEALTGHLRMHDDIGKLYTIQFQLYQLII